MRSIAPAYRTTTSLIDLFNDFDQILKPVHKESISQFDGDLIETEAAFQFSFDVPGMSESDIDIEISNGLLKITGERNKKSESKEMKFLIRERKFGKFSRTFRVPEIVDSEQIRASFEYGVLTVTMNKSEKKKPRKIEILSSVKAVKKPKP